MLNVAADQRDSAVSRGGSENGGGGGHLSEDTLGVFSLPSPDIPTHTLHPCKYLQVQAKVSVEDLKPQNLQNLSFQIP